MTTEVPDTLLHRLREHLAAIAKHDEETRRLLMKSASPPAGTFPARMADRMKLSQALEVTADVLARMAP